MEKVKNLTDAEKADYFRKSYTSVDGLWFMKVEELFGFDEALEIDRLVWSIFPKIQARTLRSMLGEEKGIDGLTRCLAAKNSIEGFSFEVEATGEGSGMRMTISRCPWREMMVKSGREALSERVGTIICNAENSTWAAEFESDGRKISFSLESQICKGNGVCTFCFEESKVP